MNKLLLFTIALGVFIPMAVFGQACTYHAYLQCAGNNIYWYSSCGNQQDLYQVCGGGLVCQYGRCVTPPPPPKPTYTAHYRLGCYQENSYWYDSAGKVNSLYKSCQDANSCTQDTCMGAGKCSNILKCDGSTCAQGSPDFMTYCQATQPQNPVPQNPQNPVPQNPVPQNPQTQPTGGLTASFFAKHDASSTQWQKAVELASTEKVYFMVTVANNSPAQMNNVMVAVNIPQKVYELGNVQLDGVPLVGDVVAGVSVGSIAPGSSKSLTFEGMTQSFTDQSNQQAVATVTAMGLTQSDGVAMTFNPTAQTAAVATTAGFGSTIVDFIKKWYLWILVGAVLVFLFIMVFRRLAND